MIALISIRRKFKTEIYDTEEFDLTLTNTEKVKIKPPHQQKGICEKYAHQSKTKGWTQRQEAQRQWDL